MSSAWSYVTGFNAFIIGVFVSICLFFAVAVPTENMVAIFETTNISTDGTIYDLSGAWAGSYDDTIFWMNLLYIVIISPTLFGLFIWFLSSIKTQEQDVFTDEPPTGQPVSMSENQWQG